MLAELNQQFQFFMAFTKANPVIAGIASLWGLGVLTFFLKSVPLKMWCFIKRQCTTTMLMNNTDIGTNQDVFNNFITWLYKSKWVKWSRSLSVDGKPSSWTHDGYDPGGVTVGVGEGDHFFMKGWRPVWVNRRKVEGKQGTHQIFYEIAITMLGRDQTVLKKLYDEFNPEPVDTNLAVMVHSPDRGWSRLTQTHKRSVESVIMPDGIMEDLIAKIQWWRDNREWYRDRGLPYKLVIVLEGPPGTGKTSLIKALSSHFGVTMCLFSLPGQTSRSLQQALSTIPEKSFTLIEDFESTEALRKRDPNSPTPPRVADNKSVESDKPVEVSEIVGLVPGSLTPTPTINIKSELITLSDILNAFDGAVPLDDNVVFLTTNHLEMVDPAFLRPGRVDYIFHVGYLKHENICDYVKLMFPEAEIPEDTHFKSVPGCDVQKVYFEHKDDAEGFINALSKESRTPTVRQFFAKAVNGG